MAIRPDARAWVEVDLDSLRANYETVRRAVKPGTALLPMVKADAYGLGAGRVVRALEPLEPFGYGVATAGEGAALRALGVRRPVLVVSPLPDGDADTAAEARLTASISSMEGLDAWVAAAERVGGDPLEYHVEVDTGMGRCGFDWRETGEWAEGLRSRLTPEARWTGAFMHFHSADAADPRPSAVQWERFHDALVQLPVSREDLVVHAANSAAALRFPEYRADAVRPGIFLYGGAPAPGAEGSAPWSSTGGHVHLTDLTSAPVTGSTGRRSSRRSPRRSPSRPTGRRGSTSGTAARKWVGRPLMHVIGRVGRPGQWFAHGSADGGTSRSPSDVS
mgnify:CR=1 FL=1